MVVDNELLCRGPGMISESRTLYTGWADIGYNFCIGDNAQVYEGRGWGR